MDDSHRQYVKQKKPDTKEHMLKYCYLYKVQG